MVPQSARAAPQSHLHKRPFGPLGTFSVPSRGDGLLAGCSICSMPFDRVLFSTEQVPDLGTDSRHNAGQTAPWGRSPDKLGGKGQLG